MFYEDNLITKPKSNKAKEKQIKTKRDMHVVVHILGDIVVGLGAPLRRPLDFCFSTAAGDGGQGIRDSIQL